MVKIDDYDEKSLTVHTNARWVKPAWLAEAIFLTHVTADGPAVASDRAG